ncbi:MAG: metabolite traffic protein EboE [Phycisphaerales bacterium]|nr:metabolite traffic protein EboE [Phycisphaerales bacterium]
MSEPRPVAWCTNVHDAHDVDALCTAIDEVAQALTCPAAIGLWLSPAMLAQDDLGPLRSVLDRHGLPCIGLNGFPAMSFRDAVVKDRVYQPAWDSIDRLEYTLACGRALLQVLPPGGEGSITTVPIGWPAHDIDMPKAADTLRKACVALDRMAADARCTLHVSIEPEPGCVLNTAAATAEFVRAHDLHDLAADGLLRICLDACHMAVMHETPERAFAAIDDVSLRIGRVQVSACPWAPNPTPEMLEAMAALDEPRWLHQTTVHDGTQRHNFIDLPDALAAGLEGDWRTHLHVPVHLHSLGMLRTTQPMLVDLLQSLAVREDHPPLEVETYAWSALPQAHRCDTLAEDIAREVQWTTDAAHRAGAL